MPRRSKPDGCVHYNLELTVLMFSIIITKEMQQKKGGWKEEGREEERQREKWIIKNVRNFKRCWVCNTRHYCKFLARNCLKQSIISDISIFLWNKILRWLCVIENFLETYSVTLFNYVVCLFFLFPMFYNTKLNA